MEPQLAAKQLVEASRLGDVQAVERLLSRNSDAAWQMTDDGRSALQVAASVGNTAIIQLLLEQGAAKVINTPSKVSSLTPVMLAAFGGYTDVLSTLIAHGADINQADKNGWTALHHAAFKGRANAVEVLLEGGAAVDSVSLKKETPLALAAMMEQDEACRVLMAHGADVALLTADSDKAFTQAVAAKPQRSTMLSTTTSKAGAQQLDDEYSFDSVASDAKTGKSSRSPRIESNTLGDSSLLSRRRSSRPASASPSPHMTMADSRGAPYAITLPGPPRRATPMYIPPTGSDITSSNPAVVGALERRARRDAEWVLQAFSFKGAAEGFVLDRETALVYWVEPQGSVVNSTVTAGNSHRSSVPVLVGRLQPGIGGLSNPSLGVICPLTASDTATVELSSPAVRCLRRHYPVASVLVHAAKQGVPVVADFVPELGGAAYCRNTLLTVPLCAVLGVHEASELSLLTPKELALCDIDPAFLPTLLDVGDCSSSSPRAVTSPRTDPGTGDCFSPHSTGGSGSSNTLPVLPTLSQLLIKHGLAKLMPAAADRRLLSMAEIHHWSEIASAAASVPLSAPELGRLKALMKSILRAQEQALALQASRLDLLTRLTVGTLVVYEADPLRIAARGERLPGIILEDLGPEAVTSVTGKQYKVRDLLDDTLLWQSPGQVRRLTPADAISLLRADLLPPSTAGAPVTPLSAASGLCVQLAPWSRATAMLEEYQACGISTEPGVEPTTGTGTGGSKGGAPEDESSKAIMQVIGVLQHPVSEDRQTWYVLWPDGLTRVHSVGAGGRFDLVHLHVHRLAGAPLTRAHFKLMLGSKDMMAVPVVRSPLWPKSSVDDSVPGSPGLGFLDAAQAAVTVVWSRSRDQGSHIYCPDSKGVYPLCHGLLGSSALTCFAAKPGVLVDAAPGAPPAVVAANAQGPGTLLQPVAFNPVSGRITWRVRWMSGVVTFHDLGTDLDDCELQVSEAYAQGNSDRVVLLNEVSKRAAKTAPATAALASVQKVAASACGCGCGGSGSCRRVAGLGRPLFAKDPARAHTWGMLGSLVKLNLAALGLQPGCEQGPLASYEPRLLSESLAAKKEGIDLGPIPRDDVGMVVKDAGPGAWRGLLVRKLGSATSFWYDESVILPATHEDVKRQVARVGPAYILPRHLQGVPVTDANAAPGMLVQRAYASGAAQEGSEKALTVGELVRPLPSGHAWQVLWPDGSIGTYKTGASNKFQLCYVNVQELAGAPLLASTVAALAAGGAGPIAVIEGPHSATTLKPGTVRHVNDPLTDQGLQLQEVAQLQATGMVATSAGERCMAGGALRLYELSHAIVPGEAVTVFTAKRGLRVTLDSGDDETRDERAAVMPPREGTLRSPTRLAVRAVLDAGSGAGSGMPGGPTASRNPVLLQDPAIVYWEVEWDSGRIEEVLVGTAPSQTPLRIAGAPANTEAAEESTESAEEQIQSYEQLAKKQHFVRMLEPVMLQPCADSDMTVGLERVAQPLQRAVGWSNQMMRELCSVWWSAARLAAATAEAEEEASGSPGPRKQLWRPHLNRVPVQPDLVMFAIKKRAGGELRWETLIKDENGEVSERVPLALDERLALSTDMINSNLLQAGSQGPAEEGEDDQSPDLAVPGAVKAKHLLLDASGKLIDTTMILNEHGRPELADENMEEVLEVANGAIIQFRAALAGAQDPEASIDLDSDQYDISMTLEPSMSAEKTPLGGCLLLHMAKEVPPVLEVATSGSETEDPEPLPEEQEGDGPWAVGPLALLATGYLPVLQGAVLQAHRAMGALSAGPCSSLMPGFNTLRDSRTKEGELLSLVGRVQYSLWLDVPERPFPADIGQARCLANVNAQLFTLRRVCASLNGCPGGGNANISEMLLAVLKVVREKASSALAVECSENLSTKATEAYEKAQEQIRQQEQDASDIPAFDHAKQEDLLTTIHEALQRLVLAEAFAHRSCHYAAAASPPSSMPAIERREAQAAVQAQQASRRCLNATVEQYNYLYPDIVEAIKKGALAMTRVMRDKQLKAEQLATAVKQTQVELQEAKKTADVAEKAAKSAEDDLAAARGQHERKLDDHQKAIKQRDTAVSDLAQAEKELQDARAELAQVGSSEAAPAEGEDAKAPAAAAAQNRVAQAELNHSELLGRVDKFTQHASKEEQEVERAEAAAKDAETLVNNRRAVAMDSRNAVLDVQNRLYNTTVALRSLDPASLNLEDERIKKLPTHEIKARQVRIAKQTTATAMKSLEALQRMAADIPSCMFAPEAVARLLARSVSALTLIAATTAAETARTSTLALEEFLLDMESMEAAALTLAGLAANAAATGGAGNVTARSAASMSATGGAAGATGPVSPPELPSIDEVYRLMSIIKNDVMVYVKQFAELAPHVPDETTITDDENLGTLNRSVLASVVDRSMLVAAQTLEKLGQAAAANVTAAITEAAAAAEASKQSGTATSGALAPSATDALPKALHAARVATLVAETARTLPNTAADMPVSDQKLALQILSLSRAAQSANNVAVKESTKLSNEQVVKLSKSGLGSAASQHSVLCAVYAELASKAESIIESQYWCNEAAGLFPKVRAAADAAISALMPAPAAPAPEEEAEAEGDDGPEKKKEDPAELAAKIAAAAEAERVINRYVAEVALKLATAAVDWAQKLMSPLSDSSSIEEISEDQGAGIMAWEHSARERDLALAAQAKESGGAAGPQASQRVEGLEPTSSQTGAAPSVPATAPHPDVVVSIITDLAEPLRIADMAFRQAGNHTGLDEIDATLKDVLCTVAEGARSRAEVNERALDDAKYKLQNMEEEASATGHHMSSVKLQAMQTLSQALVSSVEAARSAARNLVSMVPLILPPEKVPRCLGEATERCERLTHDAAEFSNTLADALESLTGDVSTAMTSTEALLHALEPSFTPLLVQLEATPSTSPRPASPSRLRGSRKAPPPPPTLALRMAVQTPSERYSDLCTRVTNRVFQQPTVRALLAPYHALLEAANAAACAVHAAAAAQPTDAEIESLLNPGSLAAAKTMHHTGNDFVTSTNMLQLKRWAPAVATMSQAASLVIRGFIEATEQSASELQPLELLWML